MERDPFNEVIGKSDMVELGNSRNNERRISSNTSGRYCCIYKVPEFILNGYEYYYQPSMMSIGPVYNQETKLETMQELKLVFLNCFLQHPNNAHGNVYPYINFVRTKEREIRGSYQRQSRLFREEDFSKMIVLDAAFLVYLLMWRANTPSFDIPFTGYNFAAAQLYYSLTDLFQMENQIPYFVLQGIFDIAFGHIYTPNTLINATLAFIGIWCDGIPGRKAIKSIIDGNKITAESSILHLVDLLRMCCCLSMSTPLLELEQPNRNPVADDLNSYIRCRFGCVEVSLCNRQHHQHYFETDGSHGFRPLSYTARQLLDAGVTFVAGETDNPLDVTFANGKLTISKITIQDSTETKLRNMIYFEQCHYIQDLYITDYIIFLDDLIDTVEDVQVLVKNKIFNNRLGSDDDVVKLFNNIGKNVLCDGNKYNYSNICRDLNRYASTRRNQWMAILRSKYFNHPWAVISVIAAFLLFVLTFLQTTAAYIYK